MVELALLMGCFWRLEVFDNHSFPLEFSDDLWF
jgi:hypothetical protein